MVEYASVGQRIKRVDGSRKITGQERFTADLKVPGMLYARPVGSHYAHARIRGVDASRALAIPGVVAVLTADDLPVKRGPNGAPPRLPVAWGEALHVGQIVALVLAESDAAAQDGAAVVEIDDEPLPVVPSPDAAMAHDAPRVRMTALALSDEAAHNVDATRTGAADDESLSPNVVDSVHLHQGDVARGFAEADEVVELTFGSRSVHQGYLEPQVCLATVEPTGDLTIYLSTQASFYSRTRVAEALGWPVGRINVVPMPVGGGFGGKYVLIEPLVAAAAVAVGRPVLMHYTRMDEFLIGNPAPGCRIELALGARRDGTLTALRARLTFDAGSAGRSPLHGAGYSLGCNYRIPHLDVRGVEVLTHKPGPGAFRAPGGQQAAFAIESAIDELARRLAIDPIAFRL
ncbi:MAG TPA: molybdopterin cofactor-binding domain-containing protein, partial [Thermomicrobiales bacterium]|nr:molybdopterin cofactor-binding domain-containing protein [Thermomicrobiales bacterium]